MSLDVITFKEFQNRNFPKETYRSICTFEYSLNDATSASEVILKAMLDDEHYAYTFLSPYPTPFLYWDSDRDAPIANSKGNCSGPRPFR